MRNPFAKKQYRITEDVDSDGKSTFYPERTILGVWCRHDSEWGATSFDTYKEANKWMCYKHVARKEIHKVDEIFNKLVK